MNKFKTGLMASMVAAAFGAPTASHAVTGIFFDQAGTGSFANSIFLSQITYNAGNALLDNVANGSVNPLILPITGAVSGNLAAQAIASNIGAGNTAQGCPSIAPNCTYFFTYQFNVPTTGNQNRPVTNFPDTFSLFQNGLGTFNIYAHTGAANQSAGTGYGADNAGILILSGSAAIDPAVNMTIVQTSVQLTPFGATTGTLPLGTIGGANRTTPTVQLTGSTSLVVDATFASTNFFLSDVTSLVLNVSFDATSADITQPEGFTAPFDANNPVNAMVVGITPDYGTNGVNDFYCTSGVATTCDMQLGTTSNTFFNHFAPEPGSLALLSLGLGIAGIGFRRRGRKA